MRRFSIRRLMAFVFLSSVGLAALRNAGELWAGMMLLAALTAVGVALMGAVILRGKERYWWAGFAFFGGGYLALAIGPWLSDTMQPRLGTTHLLGQLHGRMHPSRVDANRELANLQIARETLAFRLEQIRAVARTPLDPACVDAQEKLAAVDQAMVAIKSMVTRDQFERVGHSLFALLAGLVGGMVATWFYARREQGDTLEGD
jgi:hypothetical protein